VLVYPTLGTAIIFGITEDVIQSEMFFVTASCTEPVAMTGALSYRDFISSVVDGWNTG